MTCDMGANNVVTWQGRRKEFFRGGVVLNVIFSKGSFCTDLLPNTLYRECIKNVPKKGGSSDTFPTLQHGTYSFLKFDM